MGESMNAHIKILKQWLKTSAYFITHGLNMRGIIAPVYIYLTKNPITVKHNVNNIVLETTIYDGNALGCFYEIFIEKQYRFPIDTLKTIVDVGANVGYFAQYAYAMNPSAKIVCYEPDPYNYEKLRHNTKQYKNIKQLPYAVGDVMKRVNFYVNKHSMSSSIVKRNDTTKKITVLSYPLRNHFKNIDYVKIDVEGAELEVLRGLPSVKYIMGEYHKDLVAKQFNPALLFNYKTFSYLPINSNRYLFYLAVDR